MSVLLVVSPVAVAAQETVPSSGTPVRTLVTVETPHGANAPVINREDVMVYEGRERDKVTDWVPAQGDHAGLELFVLIDDASNTSLGSQLEDIRQFITAQPATAKVGVAYMQNGSAQITQNLTSDRSQAAKALRLPLGFPGVNSSPYFALSDLIKRWPESGARREVVMVSDGVDRYWGNGPDDPYVHSVVEQAQRAGVIVFPIYTPGVGHYGHSFWRIWWGQMYLSRVGDETGGESYYIGFNGPPVSFSPYLNDVAQRLTRQYWLSFLAKPEKKAGMQQLKVTTEVPNAELVSADGVYVPAAP
ncbi:MAG: hypothetical protein ACRD20_08370 [Terriglobales bacterium]